MTADTEMKSMKELLPCPIGVPAAIFARRCYKCDKIYFVNHKDFRYKCNSCQEEEREKKDGS